DVACQRRHRELRRARQPARGRGDLVRDARDLLLRLPRAHAVRALERHLMRRRFAGAGLLIYTILVFVFLFAPIAIVVLFSFNKTASVTWPFHGWSLRWYREVFGSDVYRSAIFASLRVGAITVVTVVVIGTLAGLGVTRYEFRGRTAIRAFLLFPAALPGLFVGIALLSFFVQTKVSLSLWTVTVGH